jgi:hypothetical protein
VVGKLTDGLGQRGIGTWLGRRGERDVDAHDGGATPGQPTDDAGQVLARDRLAAAQPLERGGVHRHDRNVARLRRRLQLLQQIEREDLPALEIAAGRRGGDEEAGEEPDRPELQEA